MPHDTLYISDCGKRKYIQHDIFCSCMKILYILSSYSAFLKFAIPAWMKYHILKKCSPL